MFYYLLCLRHFSIILTHLFTFLCLKLIISTCYPSLCWISSHEFKNHSQKLTFRWKCTDHFITISGTLVNFLVNCCMRNVRQWFSCGWDFLLSVVYRLLFFFFCYSFRYFLLLLWCFWFVVVLVGWVNLQHFIIVS
jgi:hypothetical protein